VKVGCQRTRSLYNGIPVRPVLVLTESGFIYEKQFHGTIAVLDRNYDVLISGWSLFRVLLDR